MVGWTKKWAAERRAKEKEESKKLTLDQLVEEMRNDSDAKPINTVFPRIRVNLVDTPHGVVL